VTDFAGDRWRPQLAALRSQFDSSFSQPRASAGAAPEELLAIRIGSRPCALRLADVAALATDRKITAVPGQSGHVLGIAGFRGTIVAVYDLAGLLRQPASDEPRWLVLANGSPIAFAFHDLEGQLRARSDSVSRTQTADGAASEAVRVGADLRPIIALAPLVAALAKPSRKGRAGEMREQ